MRNCLTVFSLCLALLGLPGLLRPSMPLLVGCSDGQIVVWRNTPPSYLTCEASPNPVIAGSIIMLNAGSCPATYTEVSALNGQTLLGTLSANGNVGSTGGSDNITPAGTVSQPTFTGNAFSSVINHTHTITTTWNVQGGTTAATTGTHVMTSTATGGSARVPTSGDVVSATSANPAGGVSSITPAGTVSQPSFTGTQFDNRSAFTRVIFCKKD